MDKRYLLLWLFGIIRNKAYPRLPIRLIRFLDKILNKDMVVFEYGCGLSSLYFSKRCNYLGVENNGYWFNKLKTIDPSLNIFLLKEKNLFINFIEKSKRPDIIICDGAFRNDCLRKAEKIIKQGYIILDDANRDEYDYFFLDKKYSHFTFGGLRMNSLNINSKGYFEGNYTRMWKITPPHPPISYGKQK